MSRRRRGRVEEPFRAAGSPPGRCDCHFGVPPTPLALASTHVSFNDGDPDTACLMPPKSHASFATALNTRVAPDRVEGDVPRGATWIHRGVPPRPFAWVRIHTSFSSAERPKPPNNVKRFVCGVGYDGRGFSSCGGPPTGVSRSQVGLPLPSASVSTRTSLDAPVCWLPPNTMSLLVEGS